MSTLTYREAVTTALSEELERDSNVVLIGEDIGAAGGVFKATEGLLDRFGPERVRDTPISEQAIIGCAIGAALNGLRPVAELMFADFAGVCFDQLANQMAKHRYMTGGQAKLPITVRLANGAGLGFGSQHSQPVENWFLNVPGLYICVPSNPADAYGLLKSAIRDDNPVLFFEHKALYGMKGAVPSFDEVKPIGRAAVRRRGTHLTLVATQLMCERALDAATQIAASDGIDVEIVDLRTLVPLDVTTVLDSVARTSRLMCVQEGPFSGSWGASLVAAVVGQAFDVLDGPPLVLSADSTPIPFAAALEAAWMPSVDRITSAIRGLVA